ncbi:hypothetical protein V8E53_011961 [Lactarius tabidus]
MWERRPGKYNRIRRPNYSRSFIDSSSDSNTSQPSSGTATDLSSSSTSSSPISCDPVAAALNHDPRSVLPTIAIQPDSALHDNPEPFDVIEIATAATAASLGSGTSDPLLTSGHVLPGMQPAPSSPISDQGHGHGHSHGLSQSPGQSQIRPLSPTPTAELASCVQNAWAGLCDRLGLRSSSPTSASASAPAPTSPVPDVPHPSPKPEQAPPTTAASASLSMSPADPYTQFLADMARTFQMGMGMDDTSPGTGTGSKSGAAGAQVQQASSPANAIEVNFVDG